MAALSPVAAIASRSIVLQLGAIAVVLAALAVQGVRSRPLLRPEGAGPPRRARPSRRSLLHREAGRITLTVVDLLLGGVSRRRASCRRCSRRTAGPPSARSRSRSRAPRCSGSRRRCGAPGWCGRCSSRWRSGVVSARRRRSRRRTACRPSTSASIARRAARSAIATSSRISRRSARRWSCSWRSRRARASEALFGGDRDGGRRRGAGAVAQPRGVARGHRARGARSRCSALLTWSRWCEPRTVRRLIVLGASAAAGVAAAVSLPNRLEWKSESPYLDSATGLVNYKEGSGNGRLVQYTNSLHMTERASAARRRARATGRSSIRSTRRENDPSMSQDDGVTSNPWPSSDWVAYLSERGVVGFALLLLVMFGLLVARVARSAARARAATPSGCSRRSRWSGRSWRRRSSARSTPCCSSPCRRSSSGRSPARSRRRQRRHRSRGTVFERFAPFSCSVLGRDPVGRSAAQLVGDRDVQHQHKIERARASRVVRSRQLPHPHAAGAGVSSRAAIARTPSARARGARLVSERGRAEARARCVRRAVARAWPSTSRTSVRAEHDGADAGASSGRSLRRWYSSRSCGIARATRCSTALSDSVRARGDRFPSGATKRPESSSARSGSAKANGRRHRAHVRRETNRPTSRR